MVTNKTLPAGNDVFKAIADPTRRKIIHLVASRDLNLNAIADHFPISRPAISKHIRILSDCGLIAIRQQGRERYCSARLRRLGQVSDWVEQYRLFWNSKLDALELHLATGEDKKSKRKTKK